MPVSQVVYAWFPTTLWFCSNMIRGAILQARSRWNLVKQVLSFLGRFRPVSVVGYNVWIDMSVMEKCKTKSQPSYLGDDKMAEVKSIAVSFWSYRGSGEIAAAGASSHRCRRAQTPCCDCRICKQTKALPFDIKYAKKVLDKCCVIVQFIKERCSAVPS